MVLSPQRMQVYNFVETAFKRLLKLSGNLIQPRGKMLEELYIFIRFLKIVNRQRKKLMILF